jgi:hypothetical protein
MIFGAIALLLAGTLTALMPLLAAYRTHLTRRLTRQAGATVPQELVPTLEARMARRAWGGGGGVALAGLVLLVWALVRPGGVDAAGGLYVMLSLVFVFGAAGLAVVEILWPGQPIRGPRTARVSAPVLADYLPPVVRVLSWGFPVLGLLALLTALGLSWSPWFDAGTIWRSPIPFLATAIPFLALLSVLAVRAVLAAPQRARDEADLFWQDLLRASTLSALTSPPALVALFAMILCASVLDDAASVVAHAAGQVGPAWTLWLLVVGYVVPPMLTVVALVASSRTRVNEMDHTRHRLWDGRTRASTNRPSGA